MAIHALISMYIWDDVILYSKTPLIIDSYCPHMTPSVVSEKLTVAMSNSRQNYNYSYKSIYCQHGTFIAQLCLLVTHKLLISEKHLSKLTEET